MKRLNLEADFALLWRAIGGKPFVTEHRFDPERRWRFDVAWPDERVAVELEGGTWLSGRHTQAQGFQGDCDKYNRAVELGWRVLRYTTNDVRQRSAEMLDQVTRVLNQRR